MTLAGQSSREYSAFAPTTRSDSDWYPTKIFSFHITQSSPLTYLCIKGQDMSIDTILKRQAESSDFPSPNLYFLELKEVLIKKGHQFPVMPHVWKPVINSPDIRLSRKPDDAPTYSIHRGSLPSSTNLRLHHGSADIFPPGPGASSLVDPDLMKGLFCLTFHVPARLEVPLVETDYLCKLKLGLKYTNENGLPIDALPPYIHILTIEVEVVQSTPRSLGRLLQCLHEHSRSCIEFTPLNLKMAEVYHHDIKRNERLPEDVADDFCREGIQRAVMDIKEYCISQGISSSTNRILSIRLAKLLPTIH